MIQYFDRYGGGFRYENCQFSFSSNFGLSCSVERNITRGYEFLDRPAPSKPSAFTELWIRCRSCLDICEIHVAYSRLLIPPKHRVDSFRKLCTACLVNATCVHPKVFQTVPSGLFYAMPDLLIASQFHGPTTHHVFKAYLPRSPGMRKYGISGKG